MDQMVFYLFMYYIFNLIQIKRFIRDNDQKNLFINFQTIPTILWFAKNIHYYICIIFPQFIGIDEYETLLYLICLLGIVLSFLVLISFKFARWEIFMLLWVLYLSIFSVGQQFSSFQWDILLLETGFIAIFFTPATVRGQYYCDLLNIASRELLRWLGFRLYFASGVLKLLSQCPTWWGLTALHHHFQSQCIPHLLSWYAHQIPQEIKKFMVAGNFITLIFGSLAFYFPLRGVRIFGCLLQLSMQLSIILTGNYNFFNFLAIAISIVVLDDEFIYKFVPEQMLKILCLNSKQIEFDQQSIALYSKRKGRYIFIGEIILAIGMTGYLFLHFFPIKTILQEVTKLPFTYEQLTKQWITPINIQYIEIIVGIFFIFYLIYFFIQSNWMVQNRLSHFKRIIKLGFSLLYFILIFSLSSFNFKRGLGLKSEYGSILGTKITQELQKQSQGLHLSNSYGLFRQMTGVGGRPELIIEGSQDGKIWKEYEFYYKPGNLTKAPTWVIPHQPRVDWQIWFSALTEQVQDEWLIHLIYQILNGNKVMNEIFELNQFETKPPIYVRIKKYKYFFTNFAEQSLKQQSTYWKRNFVSDFLPPISLQHDGLKQFVASMNLEKRVQTKNPLQMKALSTIVIGLFSSLIISKWIYFYKWSKVDY